MLTHGSIIVSVGSNDNIDVFNDTLESQKQILLLQLQFQKGTVHFVHQENRLDPLGDGLTEDSLSLDAHTYNQMNFIVSFTFHFQNYRQTFVYSKVITYNFTIRDHPRFFDQVRHQTTNASIENKHFFTK